VLGQLPAQSHLSPLTTDSFNRKVSYTGESLLANETTATAIFEFESDDNDQLDPSGGDKVKKELNDQIDRITRLARKCGLFRNAKHRNSRRKNEEHLTTTDSPVFIAAKLKTEFNEKKAQQKRPREAGTWHGWSWNLITVLLVLIASLLSLLYALLIRRLCCTSSSSSPRSQNRTTAKRNYLLGYFYCCCKPNQGFSSPSLPSPGLVEHAGEVIRLTTTAIVPKDEQNS
jgi:hypothetical protein